VRVQWSSFVRVSARVRVTARVSRQRVRVRVGLREGQDGVEVSLWVVVYRLTFRVVKARLRPRSTCRECVAAASLF
jgi:hypothetical protein